MGNNYKYHFCAKCGELYYDGLVIGCAEISSYELYIEFKKVAAKKMGVNDHKTVTILSLSLLDKQ